ncbi:MAG: HAMP domain-containing protein [Sulfuritalea sp.]|nr:HAMP domain-containing protein [Sulfuritalea sp.]
MRRFFPSPLLVLRDSVLIRVGLVMALLAFLSLTSITLSTIIAEDISGRANAVNVAGSLRFLTYQTLSEVLQPAKRTQASETIRLFERRLFSLERFIEAKSPRGSPSLLAIHSVVQRWNVQMRDLTLAAIAGDDVLKKQYAIEAPSFVNLIDRAVHLIEEELEGKARILRFVQLVLLGLIILISMGVLWLLHRHLLAPLAELLAAARAVSQGSFSTRVHHVGKDELGQLGQAFNTMVGEIAGMYGHLEDKVAEKTRELRRTNESLELLYRVSQQLSASDLSLDRVQGVLQEVEEALDIGHCMICVMENNQLTAHTITSDLTADEVRAHCSRAACADCFAGVGEAGAQTGRGMLTIPIGDSDRLRGVLLVLSKAGEPLPREKQRIIETVGHHVSNALTNMQRAEEKHRLAVLEERSVIARELHDSIAQSLSYLNIQVTRLEKSLERGFDSRAIADELKQGLSGAYRELRELIVTFRLRIDERGFNVALQETVAEFSAKLGFPVQLQNKLSGIVLSGNEEMHVIRIIREALSNIERHAEATDAGVDVVVDACRSVTITVSDNGKGFDQRHTPANHFGLNILHDRAQILHGRLEIDSAPGAGTVVRLQFLPLKVRQALPGPEFL